MRKLLVVVLVLLASMPAFSQTAKDKKNKDILSRSGDHLMLQLSSDHWLGAPDSVKSHIKGFSRGINVYAMLNKPFRADPRFSIAFGIGVGSSNIYFKKMTVDIAATTTALPFTATDTTEHYKKFKLSNTFLEVPIEFRFTSNPETPNKAIKVALGAKIGTMLNAHTKAKTLQDASGKTISNAIEKTNTKSYFNTTRLALTARIGYGNFTLFGAYNVTAMFKDAVAADIKLLQVGLTFSGL
ncbi:MAG: outer membrane beta-barrel protein [Ferruginibacter sp.]